MVFIPLWRGEGEEIISMAQIIFAYIVCKNRSEAKKIGKVLLQHKLAACVNILDNMHSLFWWKGKIEEANETVLIAKTTRQLFPKLMKKVKSIHSYEVPCILQIHVTDGNKEYVKWLLDQVR